MICRNCLRRFASPIVRTRSFTTQIPLRNAAEPFTVPASMSPSTRTGGSESTSTKDKSSQSILRSSVPAGTPLKGLNFYKDKQDPIAMEDTEYPEWLWGILAEVKGDTTGANAGVNLTKKAAKRAAKRAAKFGTHGTEESTPIHEQSVDLPISDGSPEGIATALQAQRDLTKAMRAQRRAAIKENNFLKAMRR